MTMPNMNDAITSQGPFRAVHPLILASVSPRRQALLTSLGLHFHVLPSQIPEPAPDPEESAADYVLRMACMKAKAVTQKKLSGIILAADTMVVLGRRILGKPKSEQEALDMLCALNNTTHSVCTGCCFLPTSDGHPICFCVCTQVTFAAHSEQTLRAYAHSGEPMGKAGAYAIQEAGAFLASHIHGSYSNVVGLPLAESVDALLDLKGIVPAGTSAPDHTSWEASCPS